MSAIDHPALRRIPRQPARRRGARTLWVVLAALAVVVAACSGSGSDDEAAAPEPADAAADDDAGATDSDTATGDSSGIGELVFLTDGGEESSLSEFYGQPLVVNFFASWCAPCRAELPDFEEVHVAAGDRVQIVGVSHDIDESSWKSLIDEVGVTFPTVFQPNQEIWESLDLFGMPSTVLITPDGEVVHVFQGPLNATLLTELIGEHLAVEV